MKPDLRQVPFATLMSEIIFRTIEDGRVATAANAGMIELIRQMAQGLSEQQRFALAERLRDLADQLEQPHVVVARI
jgi:hypothetical protein